MAKKKSKRTSTRSGRKASAGSDPAPSAGTAGAAALTRDALLAMPKVEIHRHVEGAITPEFLLEMAGDPAVSLPAADVEGLRRAISMVDHTPDFKDFLRKFETLRTFWVSKEWIQKAVGDVIRAAAEENILYIELRYNPIHFATQMAFRIESVIEWVTEARDAAAGELNLQVELIATVNRDDQVQQNIPVIEAAVDGAGQHFVGLDIAGDETATSLARFAGVMRKARAAGLGITVHAGEAGPGSNVRDAIRLIGADRIGHGIRVMEDPDAVAAAIEAGAVFEVCPSSNLRTGVVESIEKHPIADMARAGLAVTVSTDDPVTAGTTLTDEYALLAGTLGLERQDFLELNLTALQGSFRPTEEREQLAQMFEEEFAAWA
jgi:adenosine deaminase